MLRQAITTLAAVATLILVVKILAVPGPTAADTEAAKASVRNAIPIYDLHVNYPTMRALAVQKAPRP